jgi:hypothetical protein
VQPADKKSIEPIHAYSPYYTIALTWLWSVEWPRRMPRRNAGGDWKLLGELQLKEKTGT